MSWSEDDRHTCCTWRTSKRCKRCKWLVISNKNLIADIRIYSIRTCNFPLSEEILRFFPLFLVRGLISIWWYTLHRKKEWNSVRISIGPPNITSLIFMVQSSIICTPGVNLHLHQILVHRIVIFLISARFSNMSQIWNIFNVILSIQLGYITAN